jgi:hypothetical protein
MELQHTSLHFSPPSTDVDQNTKTKNNKQQTTHKNNTNHTTNNTHNKQHSQQNTGSDHGL